MQSGDAVAAGVLEREGQQRVHETGDSAAEHPKGKPTRGTQVLEVGFADRSRVFSEVPPDAHKANRVSKPA